MFRHFLTVLGGGIIFFIWHAISWMGLPFHGQALNTLPETFVAQEAPDLASGVYHYPGLDDDRLAEKVAEGPRIPLMIYIGEGTSLFDPMSFLGSLLFNLITAALLLLVLTKLGQPQLRDHLIAAVSIGLIIGFASDLPQMNWFMFPLSYTLIHVFDHIIGFALVGLFYGWRLKPDQ